MFLNVHQKRLVRSLKDSLDNKVDKEDIQEANYLTSLGLLKHAGGIRYELTIQAVALLYSPDKDLITDKKY